MTAEDHFGGAVAIRTNLIWNTRLTYHIGNPIPVLTLTFEKYGTLKTESQLSLLCLGKHFS